MPKFLTLPKNPC